MTDWGRKKTGWLRVHISPEDEESIRAAAKADRRSVTNWVEHYVVPLAKSQVGANQQEDTE